MQELKTHGTAMLEEYSSCAGYHKDKCAFSPLRGCLLGEGLRFSSHFSGIGCAEEAMRLLLFKFPGSPIPRLLRHAPHVFPAVKTIVPARGSCQCFSNLTIYFWIYLRHFLVWLWTTWTRLHPCSRSGSKCAKLCIWETVYVYFMQIAHSLTWIWIAVEVHASRGAVPDLCPVYYNFQMPFAYSGPPTVT